VCVLCVYVNHRVSVGAAGVTGTLTANGGKAASLSATASPAGLHDVFFDVAGNAAVHLEHAVRMGQPCDRTL
jgi:hypothetical protein